MAPAGRTYDVVLLGATGFTGQIAARYMAHTYGSASKPPVRWAVAGRSKTKLDQVVASVKATTADASESPDVVVCDVTDLAAVESVVKSTKVVANFAGTPFVDKALPVVGLCAKHGTDYIDITGELPLHRLSYDMHHDACVSSGAIVLHGCGYDSVPSDLCTFLAASEMRKRHGCECSALKTFVGDSSGAFSGGTLATVCELLDKGDDVPGAKECNARGAYPLDPKAVPAAGEAPLGPDTRDGPILEWDRHVRTWAVPFIMASINVPVVRKSNALLGHAYGADVRVSEAMATPNIAVALLILSGLATAGLAIWFRPVRHALFALGLLPRPGEGPTREQQDKGYFHHYTVAVGAEGHGDKTVTAHMRSGKAGDPGYKATALMSMETALTLALERHKCVDRGGVLTPACALGDALVERLNAAGMRISVDP